MTNFIGQNKQHRRCQNNTGKPYELKTNRGFNFITRAELIVSKLFTTTTVQNNKKKLVGANQTTNKLFMDRIRQDTHEKYTVKNYLESRNRKTKHTTQKWKSTTEIRTIKQYLYLLLKTELDSRT